MALGDGLPECTCDECARKAALLPALQLAGVPLAAELEKDLQRHAQRVRLGSAASGGVQRSVGTRKWLSYDPDVFLPTPFDAFVLSGHCPKIQWPQHEHSRKDVSICYIVGCGRSGSTIFAEILSHYRSVLFLNEPRQLWLEHLPLDVWSTQGQGVLCPEVGPRDLLQLADAMRSSYSRAAELLLPEVETQPVTVLEKLPEHVFRVALLRRLWGGTARFIFLRRDGLAVARSVARFVQAAWYGARDEKWRQLKDQLSKFFTPSGEFLAVLEAPTEPRKLLFARGLVEWALSVRAAAEAAGSDMLEISYEELTRDPSAVLEQVEAFLFASPPERGDVDTWARQTLRREPEAGLATAELEVLELLKGSGIDTFLAEEKDGVCLVRLVATLKPCDQALPETISTCRFAQRVANVQTFARVNEQQDPQLVISQLRQENSQLRAALGASEHAEAGGKRWETDRFNGFEHGIAAKKTVYHPFPSQNNNCG
ncbi:unnamed protein product [Cladocopium goreaui]|uniref:Protein-tyrosine sulfotransferase n=1 Tax=Cladocopium goreaui TaxID=2562237 RepID=A0A9P1DPN0_9DINO|nr:unnamed protein product [Cladocopium goreaui]